MNQVQEFIFCNNCDGLITTNTCKCGNMIKCNKCSFTHPPITTNDGDQTIICTTCNNNYETIINCFPNSWEINPDEKSITMKFNAIVGRNIVIKVFIDNDIDLIKGFLDISIIKLLEGKETDLSNDNLLIIEKEWIMALLISFFPYGENTNRFNDYRCYRDNINLFENQYYLPENEERIDANRNILKYINLYFRSFINNRFRELILTTLANLSLLTNVINIDHTDDIPMYAASKKELDKLEESKLQYGKLETKFNLSCPICMCDFEKEDEISHLSCCNTTFHNCCITKWLSESNHNCPMCRKEFEKSENKL